MQKYICHNRCMTSPPDRVFACKCPCGGQYHGAKHLAVMSWAERQRERRRIRGRMQQQLGYLDRKTEFAAFIKESDSMAEIVGKILSFEPKRMIHGKRKRA